MLRKGLKPLDVGGGVFFFKSLNRHLELKQQVLNIRDNPERFQFIESNIQKSCLPIFK